MAMGPGVTPDSPSPNDHSYQAGVKGAPSSVCTAAVNSRSPTEFGSIRMVTTRMRAGRQFFTR